MPSSPSHPDDDVANPDELTDAENVEEEFRSLMEGLRTTLPGVQLVTAFLLTVPLYEKYEVLSRSQRSAYFLAFLSAVVASLLLTAPSSHQRLRSDGGIARRHRRHLEVAVKITVWGSVAFAIALTAASYLVASLVLDGTLAAVVALGVALVCGWSWYYLPLVSFRRDG